MDLNELNKSQLILLAVLLSFITSIVTGIVTVTLMQQAPDSVTVPINRVIRQTVERIVPVSGGTTVQTVVVKEEDLVVEAIAKNRSSVFSITKGTTDAEENKIEISVGQGVLVASGGTLVTDAQWVSQEATYFVQNATGKFKANFLYADSGFSFLKISGSLDGQALPVFTPPSFGDLTKMKAGQKFLVLGGDIASFIFDGNQNIRIPVPKLSAGGAVLNLEGEVLGIALSGEGKSFAPIGAVITSLESDR